MTKFITELLHLNDFSKIFLTFCFFFKYFKFLYLIIFTSVLCHIYFSVSTSLLENLYITSNFSFFSSFNLLIYIPYIYSIPMKIHFSICLLSVFSFIIFFILLKHFSVLLFDFSPIFFLNLISLLSISIFNNCLFIP